MSKTYINAANQGVYEVDHIARTLDIPEHDASAKGLKLAGTLVTSTAAELNIMDGVTATAAELSYNAGVTPGTVTASKTLIVDSNKRLDTLDITSLEIGNVAVTATAAELNLLATATVTTAEIHQRALNLQVTLGTARSDYVVIPYTCTVTTVYSVIDAAIATGDEVFTFANNAGTAMAGTLTIANAGSAAGDVDSVSPTTNNTFTAGQKMKLTTDGGSDGGKAIFTILCTIT